ncbi:BPSL0761 family protein [Caballeronia sp. GAOx1]|uniref:BPSL0761 family protein n=1 Tax=Caballeronia sp. GAOx1 TaxID=2921761 RepID=UPI0020291E58|nr:BPSL0761 family protein [Caballeronia sp. GAOx1]
MTKPEDRTKAVADTRRFLETLIAVDEDVMWDLVRTMAMMLLRHYPRSEDIEKSALALPSVWSIPPEREKSGSALGSQIPQASLARFLHAPCPNGQRHMADESRARR